MERGKSTPLFLAELKRRVRASRHEEDRAARRQLAAGQVAGLIREIVPVRDLIEEMLAEAASIADRLPAVARR